MQNRCRHKLRYASPLHMALQQTRKIVETRTNEKSLLVGPREENTELLTEMRTANTRTGWSTERIKDGLSAIAYLNSTG
jgi:hypothetical protein